MPIHIPCARPGCPDYAVPDGRYCSAHTYVGEAQRRERDLARAARPSRKGAKAVYDDFRWRGPGQCRDQVVARAEGRCERCGREADPLHCHHILGITGTDDDFDPELIIAACFNCHPALDRDRRRGYGG